MSSDELKAWVAQLANDNDVAIAAYLDLNPALLAGKLEVMDQQRHRLQWQKRTHGQNATDQMPASKSAFKPGEFLRGISRFPPTGGASP